MDEQEAPKFDAEGFLRTVTDRPGVYRMFNAAQDIIYVGKASNLKNRLSSYFQKNVDSAKTRVLVAQICDVQTTVTASASEALLLEHNLIKEHRPRYNVVLRDDKSYPYIYISSKDEYPRISYQRGARRAKGKYIGPYPSAGAVKRSLKLVQKMFKIRQCEDSYFRNRSRPCLQYQIQRCTAPCVKAITPEEYAEDLAMTTKLLEGKSTEVIDDLAARMDAASEALDFELAAKLRDQISSLKSVSDMSTTMRNNEDADYVGVASKGGQSCVQIFFVRNGTNLGNKAFYPATPPESTSDEILNAFISQYYLEHELPREIIVTQALSDSELLQSFFSTRAGFNVTISHKVRGERAKLQTLALVGVSKGPDRRPGDETLLLCQQQTNIQLNSDSPALLLIQQIRDEAHRYAIAGHRAKRAKKRQRSSLEDIKGLGPKRRKALLTYFGGLQLLNKAGVEDIANVPGISAELARRVYDELHPGGNVPALQTKE